MDRFKYQIKPLENIYDMSRPPLNMPYLAADWTSMNVVVNDNRIEKRSGYSEDRDFGDGEKIQTIGLYKREDGTRSTMYLTEADLCLRETASGKTFSYKTETGDYSAKVKTISADGLTITFKAGTTVDTDGVEAGDYFIMDNDPDHHSADVEPDASWREIASVESETEIILTAAYELVNQDWTGDERDCIIRKVYSVPSRERWTWCVVKDKFIFTNGNVDVQAYTGTGYASALDSTNAKKARYCLSYAQRLLIADVEVSSTREPWTMQWSKSTDPTDWTDSTAGSVDFVTTDAHLTGLGQVGNNVFVYKTDSIIMGYRTGVATSPFTFPTEKRGVGNYAPYSLVHYMGTNAFLGKNDFYTINGDHAEPIRGELSTDSPIRYKFFDIVDKSEVQYTWGVNVPSKHQIWWFANSKEGQICFVWDYDSKQWTTFDFYDRIEGVGEV